MLTTTTMTQALDRTAASLRVRLARTVRVAGLIATVFFLTMSATEHVGRAAMSGEGATQASPSAAQGSVAPAKPMAKSATQATREAYQQREASSKDVGDFAGGGAGIYIGGSTAAIILLVVLIVILL